MLIALVGMPGGGKSTVGRHLARNLNLRFFDADVEIEQRIGCPIRLFFEHEGEARFRDVEQEVVADLVGRSDAVLAMGGGAVLSEASRLALRERTTVIYLRSAPEELFRRLRHDTHRPMLQVPDPLRKLRDLHTERDPLYRATAHFVIETGRPSVHTLVNMVLMQLELAGIVGTQGREAVNKPAPKLGA
ncbi:MAG: shikimate kinase [Burkholderiaceae bacterium]